MNQRPINVAMCGLGQWGPNLLRNLRENADCRVVALCDREPARLADFQKILPEAKLLSDVAEVAAMPDVDAVVLATPAGLHDSQVRLLIEMGKDVLVEKPLAMTLAGARTLTHLARKDGRILMTGHTFLFNPAVRRVRQEIESGSLGELHFIHAQRMSLGRVREDCNALWNLAPHDISILLYWLGAMPVSVSARGIAFHERHQQEDIALCVLEFPGRIMASVQVSWLNPVKVRQMTLVGSQKMLVYDDVDAERPLMLYDQGVKEVAQRDPEGSFERFRLEVRRGSESPIAVEKREPLAEEIAHFLHCIRSREEPLGSGDEALAVMSVLEACDRSIAAGGKLIVPEPI
ncbi:Gfo/Idh/MocA family oxidoreductase [soil metagenome]